MSKGPSINGSLKNLKKWVMTSFMDGPKCWRISLGHSIKHKTSFIMNSYMGVFLSWIRVSPCVSKALLLFLCKNWFWWIQHLFGTTLKSQGHFAKAWKTTIYLSFLFLEYYSILLNYYTKKLNFHFDEFLCFCEYLIEK